MSIEIKTSFDVSHMLLEICGAWNSAQALDGALLPSEYFQAGMLLGMTLALEHPGYSRRVWDLYFSEPEDKASAVSLKHVAEDVAREFLVEGVMP